MNAVGGSILAFLVAVLCVAPRRWALLGVMGGVFFLTQGQSIDVLGLNIFPLRVLEAVGFARVVVRGEISVRRLNRLDAILLLLYNYSALIWIARSTNTAPSQYASALDPTLCYLTVRGLIDGIDDLRWFLIAFVALLVPFTALVLVERRTGQSAFTLVGAAPTLIFRDGVARCQGAFRHAILLGSVAASFVPLYIGLWLERRVRVVAALGVFLCLALVFLSNSGGPVTSVGAAFIGWVLWPVRQRMRLIRWAALGLVVVLALYMKAPIWYLPFKISALVGGGGYHRSVLLEHAWQDLGKWWLVGMDIKETATWTPYVLDAAGGGVDVTNQILVFGIKAGLSALALAIGMLVLAFMRIGTTGASLRRASTPPDRGEFLVWGLGVTLFVHLVTWFGVSYFDQSYVVWLMQIAALSAATQCLTQRVASDAVHTIPAGAVPDNSGAVPQGGRFAARSRGPLNPRFRAPLRLR